LDQPLFISGPPRVARSWPGFAGQNGSLYQMVRLAQHSGRPKPLLRAPSLVSMAPRESARKPTSSPPLLPAPSWPLWAANAAREAVGGLADDKFHCLTASHLDGLGSSRARFGSWPAHQERQQMDPPSGWHHLRAASAPFADLD